MSFPCETAATGMQRTKDLALQRCLGGGLRDVNKGARTSGAERETRETADNAGYREAAHYGWAGSGDGTRSRDEMRALELLELDPDADFESVKKAWRAKAKIVHPDVRPGDEDAAKAFQALQLAYEVLRAAEERRLWKG